ncbi:MAG: murein L,D-transpeptidase catalytic domain family protein [Bdellovibrionia bacterium]
MSKRNDNLRFSLFVFTFFVQMTQAQAFVNPEVFDKVVSAGVPHRALSELLGFIEEKMGQTFEQQVYVCSDRPENSVRPCEESKRTPALKDVTMGVPQQVVIIDFKKPSSERRFFLIDLRSGEVKKYYTSHGIGSGNSYVATTFSNIKDSKQTSLGIYLTGEIYYGGYGQTLRMYGLEKSNDQAYNRDIVLHGAWYVGEDFMKSINPKTKQPFDRIGVSWGCPAVSKYVASQVIPQLAHGSLIYHFHEDLIDQARETGKTVKLVKN